MRTTGAILLNDQSGGPSLCGSRGGRQEVRTPTGKSQVAIGFLRSNCLAREVCTALCEIH